MTVVLAARSAAHQIEWNIEKQVSVKRAVHVGRQTDY